MTTYSFVPFDWLHWYYLLQDLSDQLPSDLLFEPIQNIKKIVSFDYLFPVDCSITRALASHFGEWAMGLGIGKIKVFSNKIWQKYMY